MAKKKVNTSLRLEKRVLKQLKLIAVEKETSVQAILEKMIQEYLEKKKDVL